MTASPEVEAKSYKPFVCECEEQMRSACDGLSYYKEYEGKLYCVLHFPSKEKISDFKDTLRQKLNANDFNFCGVWFPEQISFRNDRFRNKADFSFSTFSEEAIFTSTKFYSEANFSFATFNKEALFDLSVEFNADANFNSARFNNQSSFRNAVFEKLTEFADATFSDRTDFTYAKFNGETTFSAAVFKAQAIFSLAAFGRKVNFNSAKFGADSDFSYAKFCRNTRSEFRNDDTNFSSAQFNGRANFNYAQFSKGSDFGYSLFISEADFRSTVFRGNVNFLSAIFEDYVRYAGGLDSQGFAAQSSVNFQHARIEKPDHFSFHTLALRPYWFVNVDARKFEFTNVEWHNNIHQEIEALKRMKVLAPHRLLARVCRQLAINEEENHRYEEASSLRYMAMEVRRLEHWKGFAPWTLRWWYWFASGYGERVRQGFVVLIGVWLLFALLYTQVGFIRWEPRISNEQEAATTKRDDVGQPLTFKRAMTYSLSVMALQKPEPKPATNTAYAVVILETILGPLQAALLALAIRRRFMR